MQTAFVYSNANGIKRTMHPQGENQFTIHTELQMDAILEDIKRCQEQHPRSGMNKLVAKVPMTIYEQSLKEGWDEDDWKKWLNSYDAAPFRVWKGRV